MRLSAFLKVALLFFGDRYFEMAMEAERATDGNDGDIAGFLDRAIEEGLRITVAHLAT